MALARPILMMVTDRKRLAERTGDPPDSPAALRRLLMQVEDAADAGVDFVQLRERDLPAGALCELARQFVAATEGSRTRVLVNDRVDVALAAGAAGVHLPSHGVLPAAARRLLAPGRLVGCSIHAPAPSLTPEETDYVVFGTIYPTVSKPPDAPITGLAALKSAVGQSLVPVLAIGGVTRDRVADVAAAGAAGVAGIDLFLPATGIPVRGSLRGLVKFVHELFDTTHRVS